jgi:hypothetical protein
VSHPSAAADPIGILPINHLERNQATDVLSPRFTAMAKTNRTTATKRFANEAEATARAARRIQRYINKASRAGKKNRGAMQAGARRYPAPPMPNQHLSKPGKEAALPLEPMYDAPHYKGSQKLEKMTALITGGDSGIGRAVAVLFAREGADVAITYLNEHEDAAETKRAVEAEGRRCLAMPGDVANPEFCRFAVAETVKAFGKLDILVNNAAFQEHAHRIEDLTEEHFDQR